jgi:phosphoribosylglycinamide formyltransferase-1
MSFTIGWFTTAEDSKAQNLFTETCKAIKDLNLDMKIAYLFCNRQAGEDPKSDQFLTSVKNLGIDLITYSSVKFQENISHRTTTETGPLPDWQEEYHHQVIEKISGCPIDMAILVGYTPPVTIEFTKKYSTLRFQSALPGGPSGNWSTIIWQLIGTRSAESGASVQLLTEEDMKWGIPVTYCNYSIKTKEFYFFWRDLDQKMKSRSLSQIMASEGENNPLFKAIKEAGEGLEKYLLILTLQKFSTRAISIMDQRILSSDGEIKSPGYCMADDIEDFLAEEEEKESEEAEEEEEETAFPQ